MSALELEPPSCPYFGPIDALDVVSLERLYIRCARDTVLAVRWGSLRCLAAL